MTTFNPAPPPPWYTKPFTARPPEEDPHTVETSLYEPRMVADRVSVPGLFAALDAARLGNTQDLFALYRDFVLGDPHVQSEFFKRKLAVLGDKLSVNPQDPKNAEDVAAAAFIDAQLKAIPQWRHVNSALLDSALWPVSVVEKVFTVRDGKFTIARLIPVPHHLEDYMLGRLRIRRTDNQGMPLNEFEEIDPDRYIVHRGNLLNMPDNLGGPMRSILFWMLFRTCNRDWWVRFLDRFLSRPSVL